MSVTSPGRASAGDAGALLAEAFAAGAAARLEAGRVLAQGAPPELLARMREALRAAIAAALARCRRCGCKVDLAAPGVGVVCGDGRPEHLACYAAAATRRARAALSPEALADQAGATMRGEAS